MALTQEVRARIAKELKRKVEALALMRAIQRGDAANDSTVVREALIAHFERPDIAALVEEGLKRLDQPAGARVAQSIHPNGGWRM